MENETVYTDKAGLEDLITFHDAEFEIIDGYYYNERETIRFIRSSKIHTI